jgi:hypothetical protein
MAKPKGGESRKRKKYIGAFRAVNHFLTYALEQSHWGRRGASDVRGKTKVD